LTVRYREEEGDAKPEAKPSLDAFYKITSSLTAALTVNTDFAETEVDEREINLSRFDLFFPEKRAFFLQDTGIFDFGGLTRNGRPFFSRRIGLDEDGEEVDIIAGAKLTGRVDDFNIGLLDVQTDSKGELDSKNLFVGRLSMNVLEESSVGMILTNGNPTENEDNSLVGVDFRYRDTSLIEDQALEAILWAQRSFTPEFDDKEYAFGGQLRYPGDEVEVTFNFAEIQQNFRPALGFLNRRGIRQYDGEAKYQYRFKPGSYLRKVAAGLEAVVVSGIEDDEVQTVELKAAPIELSNEIEDTVELFYLYNYELLDEEFEIVDGIVIPPGTYPMHGAGLTVEASTSRPLFGSLTATYGEFYDGTRLQIKPVVAWFPAPWLFFNLEYEFNDVRLPQGDFRTHLVRGRVNFQFTTDISWNTLVQYDNVSGSVGVNSRFSWIIEPGSELFLVFNQSLEEDEDGTLGTTVWEIASKLGWTFRF
jgi:hypothetical protein